MLKFHDISVSKKLFLVVAIMLMLATTELFVLWFMVSTLSATRAYVGGEGLWSKAQKNATYFLYKYAVEKKEDDYQQFLTALKVPMGDRKARLALESPTPDFATAKEGFIQGGNHSDDVEGLINLIVRFHNFYYINKAIKIWNAGDDKLNELLQIGEALHTQISSGTATKKSINTLILKLEKNNDELTILEDEFSYTLGAGSRWLEGLVLKILLAVAITVEATGIILSYSIGRNISRGIKEILRVSKKVAKADFSEHAKVYSNDEIGELAAAVNNMVDSLEAHTKRQMQIEELKRSNQELEQFAYVASHDLQEPLRTITNATQLLSREYKDKLDENANHYIDFAVKAASRMRELITDLLAYSRVTSKAMPFKEIDCNKILHEDVLANLKQTIVEKKVEVKADHLPKIMGDGVQISQLFQNLISNAIKFCEKKPVIQIRVTENKEGWIFAVQDNGIGISEQYFERIFVVFQRLHNREKYPGTGIGLAICKKIVERHGGKIWVQSKPNEGTTFYFSIPKE